MNNKKNSPYSTYGLNKIDSPKKEKKDTPRATKTENGRDLRGCRK